MSTISWDFGIILVLVVGLFISISYPLYALATGKIISGGKEYSKEKNPRIYWALVGLIIGVGIFVFLLSFVFLIL
jgi:hypothetical protein